MGAPSYPQTTSPAGAVFGNTGENVGSEDRPVHVITHDGAVGLCFFIFFFFAPG
jgi:hypothetical protein